MKRAALPFVDPFTRNHCVPVAFTVVGPKPSAKFAVGLADAAYWRVHPVTGVPLLRRSGRAPGTISAIQQWAELANVRIVEDFKPRAETRIDYVSGREVRRRIGRPTVAQFRKGRGRRGRWVVFTDGHAQAIINGKVFGWHGPRSRVHRAFRVEVLP